MSGLQVVFKRSSSCIKAVLKKSLEQYNQRPKYFILLFILMFSHLEHSWLLSPAGWWPHAVRDTQVAKHAVADVRNAVKYHHNNLNISKNTHLMIDLELSLTIATFLLFPEPVSQEDFRNEWWWLLLQSLLKVFFFFRLYPKIFSFIVACFFDVFNV